MELSILISRRPSEVCIYLENMSYASYAAAEMWAQLEHDPDASAICVVKSQESASRVNQEAANQLTALKDNPF